MNDCIEVANKYRDLAEQVCKVCGRWPTKAIGLCSYHYDLNLTERMKKTNYDNDERNKTLYKRKIKNAIMIYDNGEIEIKGIHNKCQTK